jgi:ABC-type lipoprotein export system ATPase subunit
VLVGRSGSSKNLIPLLTMEENLLLPLDLNGRPPG